MSDGSHEVADVWSAYDFLIPGILLMQSAAFPPGTAQAAGMGPPDPSLPATGVTFTSQAVTPLGNRKARYFFSWGPRADQGDEALRDMLMGVADQAFTEDRIMIEAQQRVIDATPDLRMMPTGADKGVTLYTRLVERLVRGETGIVEAA